MSFDTTKLEELLDCLKKGAEAADARAIELAAQGERDDARREQRRAARRREWAAALEVGIKVLQRPSPARRSPAPRIAGEETPSFEAFWKAYPRKKSKGDAWKAWNQVAAEPIASDILSAVARQKNSNDWIRDDGVFIPHPATWLRAKGWLDEVNTPLKQVSGPRTAPDPEHWTEFLLSKGLSHEPFQFARPTLKSEFAAWRKAKA